jgi:amino acid adenylation domain-containing protein
VADHSAMTGTLTQSQKMLWSGQRLDPSAPLYNMALVFRIAAAVDCKQFQRAFADVVAGCDALRTVFVDGKGAPVRQVLWSIDSRVQVVDFLQEPVPADAAQEWCKGRARRVFALDAPLFECALLQVHPDETWWFFNQHHLITDASATALVYKRVASAYAAGAATDTAIFPQFEDHVACEVTSYGSDAYRDARSFWKDQASRARPAFPYGAANAGSNTRSERIAIDIGVQRSRQLRAIAMEPGIRCFTEHLSLYNIFASLLFAYLRRVSLESNLALATPAHNRLSLEARETVGVFIELFPLVVSVADDDSFLSLLNKVQVSTGQFLRHARPGASDPEFNRSASVVLNYINAAFSDFAGLPMQSEWIHSGHADRGHLLRLQVHDFDASGAFRLFFDCNASAFDALDRERIARHFTHLIDAFLLDRQQLVGNVDLSGAAGRGALMEGFNIPAVAVPLPSQTVVELFLDQVAKLPEKLALRCGNVSIDYGELDQRSARIALALGATGIGAGNLVVLAMHRSINVVPAILGVLRAGAAYVPLDLAHPEARLRQIVDDTGAKMVLTSAADRAEIVRFANPNSVVCVDDSAFLDSGIDHALPPPPSLAATAYLIYTSGSTGVPKGIPIIHAGLADYITWSERVYTRGERMTFPLFTSLAFDLTVTSLFLPLITGGSLIIYPETGSVADSSVIDVLRENAVDFIKLTPSHLSLLNAVDLVERPRIRRMVVGGEDFRTSLARSVQARLGPLLEIYNEYGPTEAVVGCMIHRFDVLTDTRKSVPIGRPADHVQLYVVDEHLALVPEGVIGELCISRHGLAFGYFNQPQLTAERFVPHPFLPGQRLYRTGDLARFHQSGSLEYMGRADRQMKIAGFRVEGGEIEAAMESHPAIQACVVTLAKRSAAVAFPGDAGNVDYCVRCAMPSNYPDVHFDDEGVCHICRDFESYRDAAQAYFKPMADLEAIFKASGEQQRAAYDCIVLLSGGKDSTYALYQLAGMGLKVCGFTLDNGYLSDQAMANIRRVVQHLGIDHTFATTTAMVEIFRDSLERFSNVCNSCFKTVYTLSVNRARELGAPLIVTGLSRGQFFETRLTPELFREGRFNNDDIDAAVIEARKVYHRTDDAVNRCLDVRAFSDDAVFDQVRFVDFYRYCDVGMSEMLEFLVTRTPWQRPTDTGRSTNCRINDVGIFIHNKERGYHNYALPYSWDVRLGHKTREEAILELNDQLDLVEVRSMLAEIGYDENRLATSDSAALVVYYVVNAALDANALRQHLMGRLPAALVPSLMVELKEIPLTANGKVDYAALPNPEKASAGARGNAPLDGEVELQIASIWSEVLKVPVVDAETSFFSLGGASLPAMEVMLRICRQYGISVPLSAVFQRPTVRSLAAYVEQTVLAEIEGMSEEEAAQLLENG